MSNETNDPIDVISKPMLETNSLVEEFMLLANISVADHIFKNFPECAVLRRHPIPPASNFEPILKAGNTLVNSFWIIAKRLLAIFFYFMIFYFKSKKKKISFDFWLFQGFDIKTDSNKELAASLDAAVNQENPYMNTMLRILATRCMLQAVYFCSGTVAQPDFYHYGLAAPIYTHFTSPIRRYYALHHFYY